jgi:hypothetical protein
LLTPPVRVQVRGGMTRIPPPKRVLLSSPQVRSRALRPSAPVWAKELRERRPEVSMQTIEKYLHNLYRARPDFVYSLSREFARNCQTPMLVLPDDTPAHAYQTAISVAHPWTERRHSGLSLERSSGTEGSDNQAGAQLPQGPSAGDRSPVDRDAKRSSALPASERLTSARLRRSEFATRQQGNDTICLGDGVDQSCGVRNVSQLATSPDFRPFVNQRVRCAEEPCVKASGTT